MAFTTGFWAADTVGSAENMNNCLLGYGPVGDFPAAAAGNKGMLAYATDGKIPYYSDGANWIRLEAGRYIEIQTPPDVSPGTAGSWQDWDLSGTIPLGAKAVAVQWTNIENYDRYAGCRKNGSASTHSQLVKPYGTSFIITELDSLRIVEVYQFGGTYKAIGYFN